MLEVPEEMNRYSRQVLYPGIGIEGQRRLGHATVALVGCGALGSALANQLVRAGLGALRIIDRDFIEPSNLQRQTLFDEQDIAQNLPKAEAAARKLRRINSGVEVSGLVEDVTPANITALCGHADLLLDGTDNLQTRFLMNDFAVQAGIPWVFGGCLGAEGLVMPIVPGRTPCLRCVWEEIGPGLLPTCDTVGILAPAVNVVASLQVVAALKILTAGEAAIEPRLIAVDVWAGRTRVLNVGAAREGREGAAVERCPCCQEHRFDYLVGDRFAAATELCGRNAVQIRPSTTVEVDFRAIAERLPRGAGPKYNEFLLRFRVESCQVTVFGDGRAIIQGTSDPALARSIYARHIGN